MEKWYGNTGLPLSGEVLVHSETWNPAEGSMAVALESLDLHGLRLISSSVIAMDRSVAQVSTKLSSIHASVISLFVFRIYFCSSSSAVIVFLFLWSGIELVRCFCLVAHGSIESFNSVTKMTIHGVMRCSWLWCLNGRRVYGTSCSTRPFQFNSWMLSRNYIDELRWLCSRRMFLSTIHYVISYLFRAQKPF